MPRIVFLTAFLGLVMGTQTVELRVEGDVARVDLFVDGRVVGSMAAPPWRRDVNLGDTLAPHRIEARAYDASGALLTSAMQKVNAPAPPRELQIEVEDAQRARLRWSALDVVRPDSIEARLDGKPVDVQRDYTLALPPVEDGRVHLLEVTARAKNRQAEAQLVFGEALQMSTTAEMSAIPVRDWKKGNHASVNGEDVRIAAVDDLPAEVILVRDPSSREAELRLDFDRRRVERSGSSAREQMGRSAGRGGQLTKGDRVRFLWPAGQSGKGTERSMLFTSSRSFEEDLGILLVGVSYPGPVNDVRYADAVAVAALQAAGSQRPRAVVLILGSAKDASQLKPADARAYAASLGVPLHVWSFDKQQSSEAPNAWGATAPITTRDRLRDAVNALRADLDAQRILWVEGDYLPNEVTVRP